MDKPSDPNSVIELESSARVLEAISGLEVIHSTQLNLRWWNSGSRTEEAVKKIVK